MFTKMEYFLRSWKRKRKILVVIVIFCCLLILKNCVELHGPIRRIRLLRPDFSYAQIPEKAHCDENSLSDYPKYVLHPMITVVYGAGLGNQLFEVFSLLGIAKTLNRTAIFNLDDYKIQSGLKFLREKLPHVATQVISIRINISESVRFSMVPDACCHYHIPRLMLCEQAQFLFISAHYFQSFKYFSSIETSIREWLKPPKNEEGKLRELVAEEEQLRFKTCVHMRRGDFLTDGHHSGSNSTFTIVAINHLYNLNPGLMYMFSNDNDWVQKNVLDHLKFQENIRLMNTSAEDAVMDLYFSQIHCDSVLITAPSSTFGWWMGYLSKNMSNVYYRDIREVDDNTKFEIVKEDFYPAEWKEMKMSEEGRVYISQ